MAKLGQIVNGDVWVVGMMFRIVLVIALCGIKRLQRDYLRHDGTSESFCAIELINICPRDSMLVFTGKENH